MEELRNEALVLLKLLSHLVSRTDNRNKKKGERHNPGICMAVGALLKERNREMKGIQTFISLVLFSSRVSHKVCANSHSAVNYI